MVAHPIREQETRSRYDELKYIEMVIYGLVMGLVVSSVNVSSVGHHFIDTNRWIK